MRQKKELGKRVVTKRSLRRRKSRLKAKLKTCRFCSWEVIEKARKKLDTVKLPKHRITRATNFYSNKRVRFLVPKEVDYYKKSNYEILNTFLADIRDCALRAKRRVFLDFSETKFISAAAMLSFLAEIDVITKKSHYGSRSVSFNHPREHKMESVLKQVGFYDLLKKQKRETKEYEDVTFWKYTSGVCSEPILAKEMITDIKSELKKSASKKLYRGFVEAMSNSVEHAYADDSEHCEEDSTAKWWTFAGIRNAELVVVLCDKGVGIPQTLPRTQGPTKIQEMLNFLGVTKFEVKDSTFIQAASSLSHTRTGQSYRGKGLTDMKSVIDSIGNGFMSIFSNSGRYIYKGSQGVVRELTMDYKHSVSGTIVEWTIPLKGDE
ncbi:ATP-binding protein [Vibrio fluvialis]|uniref:ATP-binding protein n=1 Tax=Vibrio fluvialis TaxID=676 RepID=UPI00192C2604|nr:ATP-binding protein [Vibrio fluvialis]EHU4932360.1 ATP-binding protein [Vibrio vulnificus]EIZ1457836.1 ATP-binding protein [Vibrio vulnificus]EJE8569857.1 ATP-binding protein [Vibrio vulnificus]EKA7349917.1 ATP-binding protein [Vibrio vulnificus]ELP6734491.1 ATP-binding protein [Vibrio vulnificus]